MLLASFRPEFRGCSFALMALRHRHKTFFREWRKYRDLTQERAAARMEFTQENLSRLETGKHGYSQESLEAMAFAYRCSPADLFRDPLAPENELAVLYGRFSERQRAAALRVLKAMVDEEAS